MLKGVVQELGRVCKRNYRPSDVCFERLNLDFTSFES